MRLILVRHGQTVCNLHDVWHGWDDCELTEIGLRQAEATAARLAAESIAAVYSSDSRRAMQTAWAIALAHHLEPHAEPALRERNAGEFEGLRLTEVLARCPTVWQERDADLWGWRPPGGESLRELLDRASGAVERFRQKHPDESVVVVSHMSTTRVLISRLAGMSLEDTFKLDFPSTGVSIFTFEGDQPRAEILNDATHVV